MHRKLKTFSKRFLFALHKFSLNFGIHVLPAHYYSALANIRELKVSKENWAKPLTMKGIECTIPVQENNCKEICKPFQIEYQGNANYKEGVEKHYGPGYGYIEAQALHAVIRYYKPKKIIEVGSGVSTFCSWKAVVKNKEETGKNTDITCIEPYPSATLLKMQEITVLQKKVQDCDFEIFEELEANDLLFIDSSHTVKPGSDVNFLILEVLPRLKPGVIVHFHDIYFPYNYQRDILYNFLQWNETALLHAFLINNNEFGIIMSLSMLHYEAKNTLKEVFPEYTSQPDVDGMYPYTQAFQVIEGHFPSSIYLKVV